MMGFAVGDKVTYHGSLPEYHNMELTITDLFEFSGVPCAQLQGPHFGIWVQRCRVKNLKHVQ
jgi:hypothetical protein